MVMNSKENASPDIPKDITLESLSEWRFSIQLVLKSSPWTISGTSILIMNDLEDPSTPFRIQTSIFSKHLVIKLTTNKLTSIIKEFESLIVKDHGVSLFFALFDELLPQRTNKIQDYVGSLGGLIHKSSETANEFKVRSSCIWEGMAHLDYNSLEDIQIAFLQKGFLDGAYKSECCLETVDNKLIYGDIALTDDTEESFTKYTTSGKK